jgi:hypothetical protein
VQLPMLNSILSPSEEATGETKSVSRTLSPAKSQASQAQSDLDSSQPQEEQDSFVLSPPRKS